ncbi:MAG TPA: cytochrome c [Thiobacillaceae bacterium]|nr:cytochrome c [Thiobacillaceae bacterium]
MRHAWRSLLAWAALVAMAPSLVFASGKTVLGEVMAGQGKRMQLIAAGIAREDYDAVSGFARAVNDPPRPAARLGERVELLRLLAGDVGRFKALDAETKAQAMVLAKAARSRDGKATIEAFRDLQLSCLACHTEFRHRFRADAGPRAGE